MSYSIIALFTVIVVQAMVAYHTSKKNRELRSELEFLKKDYAFLVKCDKKNVKFIGELIETNQGQAQTIRKLKNRISF